MHKIRELINKVLFILLISFMLENHDNIEYSSYVTDMQYVEYSGKRFMHIYLWQSTRTAVLTSNMMPSIEKEQCTGTEILKCSR